MGFLGDLFGGGAAKAAKKAAGIQAAGAQEVRGLAESTTASSLADLDAALGGALSEYDTGASTATGALQPYASAGTNALDAVSSLLGLSGSGAGQNALDQLMNSPAYQFALKQGYSALERVRNAGQRLYGGGTLKAAQEYGQGFATQQTGNLLDRLSQLVTGGQSAAGSIANIATGTAGNRASALLGTAGDKANVRTSGLNAVSDAISGKAAAEAGGVIGAAQAKAAGVQNILNLIGGVGKLALGTGAGNLNLLGMGGGGAGQALNQLGYRGIV